MVKIRSVFPPKNPVFLGIYGTFNKELEMNVKGQFQNELKRTVTPDGLILLIDSKGGDTYVLETFINALLKIGLPSMGFVENEAMSAGAELLLSCDYRVATPFARILFHHGTSNVSTSKMTDPDVVALLVANQLAEKQKYLDRFRKVTKQSARTTRAIYESDESIPSVRALDLGIIHKITEDVFCSSLDDFR